MFGGILIVTGPTVIAPLLRQARLARRPALLLQWEAIVNDPIGALAAVLAFEVVLVLRTATGPAAALVDLALGVGTALLLGIAAGIGLAAAFRRGAVPEFMKAPVLFAVLLLVFAASDRVLHESGLLAVTVMGLVIANAELPSYEELRRFKEHVPVLLVSGVFILLAASLDVAMLAQLNWRAGLIVALLVLVARPLTVFASLASAGVPWREQVLVALTGPRGVVLVAVAGLFGERLAALGVADGALIGPLAFVLVAATVVVHGFSLGPFARALGLAGRETRGVLLIGGHAWTIAFARALQGAEVPVLLTDPDRGNLREARDVSIPTFHGDILSEAAEHRVELVAFQTVVAATDNDAYNTLVATDLAPKFGRENVYQVARSVPAGERHMLPPTLGGRRFGSDETVKTLNRKVGEAWRFEISQISERTTTETWRAEQSEAILVARITASGEFAMLRHGADVEIRPGSRLIWFRPPGP